MDVSELTEPQSVVVVYVFENSMQREYSGTFFPLLSYDFDCSTDSYSHSIGSKICRSLTCWCVCPVTVTCGLVGIFVGHIMYRCASVLKGEYWAQEAGCDGCADVGNTAIRNTFSWIWYSFWCSGCSQCGCCCVVGLSPLLSKAKQLGCF